MRIQSLRGALFCVGILVSVAQPAAGQVSEGADAIIAGAYAHAIALLAPQVTKDPQDVEVRGLLAAALYLNRQPFAAPSYALVLHRLDPEGRLTAYLVTRHFLGAFRRQSKVVEHPRSGRVARS